MNDDAMLSRRGVTLTWKMLVGSGLFVAICALVFVGVKAQQQPTIKPLTADDKEELRELLHRYAYALENCPESNNGYDYADLFTEDGPAYAHERRALFNSNFKIVGHAHRELGHRAIGESITKLPGYLA